MKKDIIISLCDYTGNFTKPWVEAGYTAIHIDPQRENNGTILEMMDTIGKFIRSGRVAFVAGFPPCTDVAVSGARWFHSKREKDRHFQTKAALVAEQCRIIGMISGAPWFFENPVSVFSGIFGKPHYIFHPYEYAGYLDSDDDYYSKKTCLWTGGGFIMPIKKYNASIEIDRTKIHYGKKDHCGTHSNFRSATPMGFACAIAETFSEVL